MIHSTQQLSGSALRSRYQWRAGPDECSSGPNLQISQRPCRSTKPKAGPSNAWTQLIARSSGFTTVLGKSKLLLHPLYDGRKRLPGFVPIGFAEPDASNSPICIETRFGRLPLDDNSCKCFTTGISFLDSFGNCRLQTLARNRTAVIKRSLFRKPSQMI